MSLETAAQHAAKRLRIFRRIADNAADIGERVDLAPAELWEPEDQAVLDALELELRLAKCERPLLEIAS